MKRENLDAEIKLRVPAWLKKAPAKALQAARHRNPERVETPKSGSWFQTLLIILILIAIAVLLAAFLHR